MGPTQQQSAQQPPPPQQQIVQSQPNNSQAGAPGSTPPPGPPTSGEGRKISCEDIQLVQNLIERCLQLYMNRAEVIGTLLNQAKIEPGFTGLVWQKLEEQNPVFFKAYYVRLKLKRQIMIFNYLLEQHAQLTQKVHPPVKAAVPGIQNGMHAAQVHHHMPIGYPLPQQPSMAPTSHPHMLPVPVASMSTPVLSGAPEGYGAAHGSPSSNGVGNMNSDMSLLPTGTSIPLSNDLNMGPSTVLQGNSAFPFAAMGNPTDISGISMDGPANFPSDASFHSSENHVQNGIGSLQLTADADAPGGRESILGALPRNFSLSDLTAELDNSSDIYGYTGSPFLGPDADVFIRSSDDEKMLDQITAPAGYDDFEDVK